jgi:hypothetical protein
VTVPHDWLELDFNGSSRRWCCTPIARGGCGAYQIWRQQSYGSVSTWFPPVGRTCTSQLAYVNGVRKERRAASQRYRDRKLPALWFWAVGRKRKQTCG